MALTKTNTDNLCPPTSGSNPLVLYLQKLKYRYYLWTGLYMLETHERLAFHLCVGPVVVALWIYVGVFARGVLDGWSENESV